MKTIQLDYQSTIYIKDTLENFGYTGMYYTGNFNSLANKPDFLTSILFNEIIIYNENMLQDKRVRELLLEYII